MLTLKQILEYGLITQVYDGSEKSQAAKAFFDKWGGWSQWADWWLHAPDEEVLASELESYDKDFGHWSLKDRLERNYIYQKQQRETENNKSVSIQDYKLKIITIAFAYRRKSLIELIEKKLTEIQNNAEPKKEPYKIDNVFCRPMPIDEAIGFFGILKYAPNKAGKTYLDSKQFSNFIDKAFRGMPIEGKINMNWGRGDKSAVIALFHMFYTNIGVNGHYEANSHCKDKYVHLLTDNFEGFEFDDVQANFKSQNKADYWEKARIQYT